MAYNVLISGSACEYSQYSSEDESKKFIYKLGYELVKNDCSESNMGHGLKIINGNGFGVGPYLYEGIAEAAATYGLDMADYLLMYPFPKPTMRDMKKRNQMKKNTIIIVKNDITMRGCIFPLWK